MGFRMSAPATPAAPDAGDKLDRGVLKVASVVVLGAIMAILDTTVVNVALQKLTIQFTTSFDTIQWVATGYMLALATVIPVTGWASDRFGTKRLYLLAIGTFLIGSMLAGLAWNVESLIAFRVVQGLGGGMLMPAGMTILTRTAGPQRIGRVMSVLGVPMLLGPMAGPILGGWLVDSVSWRWIFYINVPIGLIAFLLALKLLPKDDPEPSGRFDFLGMLMVSPGLAALIFGVSRIPSTGTVGALEVWLPALAGIVLLVAFVLRARTVEHPLIDLKLFRNRSFSVAMATMAVFCIGFFGAMLLLPTYFVLVRGETALNAGLLLVPQSLGAVVSMPIAGRLADKIAPRKIVVPGLVLIVGRHDRVHPGHRHHVVSAAARRAVRGRARPRLHDDADHLGRAADVAVQGHGEGLDRDEHPAADRGRDRVRGDVDHPGGAARREVRRPDEPGPAGRHRGDDEPGHARRRGGPRGRIVRDDVPVGHDPAGAVPGARVLPAEEARGARGDGVRRGRSAGADALTFRPMKRAARVALADGPFRCRN